MAASKVLGVLACVLVLMAAQANGDTPLATPTFHCLGIYWSPPDGSADKQVQVRYRRSGQSQWQDALPMRYNPIAKTDLDLARASSELAVMAAQIAALRKYRQKK